MANPQDVYNEISELLTYLPAAVGDWGDKIIYSDVARAYLGKEEVPLTFHRLSERSHVPGGLSIIVKDVPYITFTKQGEVYQGIPTPLSRIDCIEQVIAPALREAVRIHEHQ